MLTRPLLSCAIAISLFLVYGALVDAAPPDPCPDSCRPKAPGLGIQAGVTSVNGAGFSAATDRVETQVAHEGTIVAPSLTGSSYSYSLVGITEHRYVLRMGYIVLAGENGFARFFVQVLKPNGSPHYWLLSRAGAANPPPACSACSGDTTTAGYPFSFGLTRSGTWTFWFDWISKAQVKVPASRLTQVYFLGEVSHAAMSLDPRKALTTYRVWSSSVGGDWSEPAGASVYRSNTACNDADGSQTNDYDVQRSAENVTIRNDNKTYKSTLVGSLLPPDGAGASVGTSCGLFAW
ncbi:MAG TPA: hypothetical protein VJB57_12590 [Dehalococcoidia bacterium]|nr:hypothetical protein [Dehalococcoidia bacterium]